VPSDLTSDLTLYAIEPTEDEVRERMSGNLCRCGAHNGIIEAVLENLRHPPGNGVSR
jgi:xanthine dehydrogenase YagT iron-sulfur-binding subunit